MKVKSDAAIDHVGQCSIIVHAHIICVVKALYLGLRETIRHRLVFYVYQVVHICNWLGCVAHSELVHCRG